MVNGFKRFKRKTNFNTQIMNGTVIKEDKLKEMKNLAKKINDIELEILCFGSNDNLVFELRKKTELLTELILEL